MSKIKIHISVLHVIKSYMGGNGRLVCPTQGTAGDGRRHWCWTELKVACFAHLKRWGETK